MAKIDSFNFGFIVVDGKQYVSDVVILPYGTVKERDPGKGRVGSHTITRSEIDNMVRLRPEVILVGTGIDGLAKLSGDAEAYHQQVDFKLVVLPSNRLVPRFNQLTEEKKKVAALIHITC